MPLPSHKVGSACSRDSPTITRGQAMAGCARALQGIPFVHGKAACENGFDLPDEHADLRHRVFVVGGMVWRC